MPNRVDLRPTLDLHRRLLDHWREWPRHCDCAARVASLSLAEHGTKFEGAREMAFALSACRFDERSVGVFRTVGETLHAVVEKALDWVFSDEGHFDRHFSDHARMRPWLRRTAGQSRWQGVSRYDAVVTATGEVKILELNTGCPAGFFHADDFSRVTWNTLRDLGVVGDSDHPPRFGTIRPHALVEALLQTEAESGRAPGVVALVNDENRLQNELALMQRAFVARGRDATVVHASDVEFRDGQAWHAGRVVSLAYNKIRLSTADSPGDHWRPGFEQRYAGFLEAVRQDAFVAVNNLASLTVGEDKGLLEVLREPAFQATLTDDERTFVRDHVLWTARLADREVDWHGRTVEMLPFVRENRERLVVKPANEGRGLGVVVGRHATQEEWDEACRLDPAMPKVVQEFAEPAKLPVVRSGDEPLRPEPVGHYLTVGLAMVRGRYEGLLSRVSANPVTNVGRQGVVQAVFVDG